jgi:preprotein translocase subunit SecE
MLMEADSAAGKRFNPFQVSFMAETLVSTKSPKFDGASIKKSSQTPANADEKSFKDKSLGFFGEVVKEMRKVSWPTREQLQDATIITLVVCVIFSAFVFGVDKIFETVLRLIYSI